MNQDSNQNIVNHINTENGTSKILNLTRTNVNELDESLTKITTKENIIKIDSQSVHKIKVYKVKKRNVKDEKYQKIIKKIAKKLKKRTCLPKCKIFKIFLSYRILILRIAKGLKKTAKNLNFWEKWENRRKNKTEQDIDIDIDKIQEIATTACKIIQGGVKKQAINKKKLSSYERKNKKNIELNLTLFTKDNELKEEKIYLNRSSNKKEMHKDIIYLRNLNTENNMNNFINNFSSFLKKNNIDIMQDSKLPIFQNNYNQKSKYLLSTAEFWIKYIIYISHIYKNDLTIYNYINFIEQFYIWNNNNINDDNNNTNTNDFNMEIKKQINNKFSEEEIKNFLLLNKTNNLDDLFQRYNIIHTNYKNNKNNYIEAKINDIQCKCPTCINNGFINIIINYNKTHNEIRYSRDNYITYNDNKNIDDIKRNEKYYDTEIFDYLNKIEKGKKYEDENENVNDEKKEKKNSIRKQSKNKNKSKSKENYNKKSYNVQDIFDLLSIDGDFENSDDNIENINLVHKKPKRKKSRKKTKK